MRPEVRPILRASVLLYGYRLIASSVVAYPAVRALASFGAAMNPDGDLSLFEAGGYHLLESLRLGGPALGAAAESGLFVTAVVAVVGLLPLAASLALLSGGHERPSALARRAVELF